MLTLDPKSCRLIIDCYSRKVLPWRISNSMVAAFHVDCLEYALHHHGQTEVFNSDQGSPFTSSAFTRRAQT